MKNTENNFSNLMLNSCSLRLLFKTSKIETPMKLLHHLFKFFFGFGVSVSKFYSIELQTGNGYRFGDDDGV